MPGIGYNPNASAPPTDTRKNTSSDDERAFVDRPSIPRIVAPASSVEQARTLFEAGAHEVYAGFMPPEWERDYGDGDTATRRQGRFAHLRSRADLTAMARLGVETGHPIALTFNARYSPRQLQDILGYVRFWEDAGGTAIVVADPGLLLALRERNCQLEMRLSVLANVYNPSACAFFAALGVSRIVLPRSLPLDEISAMATAHPNLSFEALVLYQKCCFIDGLCGFQHSVHVPENVPSEFAYTLRPGDDIPETWSCDPYCEGHGCQLPWTSDGRPIPLHPGNDFDAPACGACYLKALAHAGVGFFKIAGRGYPEDMVVRGVRYLAAVKDRVWCHGDETSDFRDSYFRIFGRRCHADDCYRPQSAGSGEF